jgi:type II secretory pathway pseudopilin PulG
VIAREPVGRNSVEPETNTLEMGWRVSGSAERRPTKNCRTCEKAAAIPPATPEHAITIVELLVVIMIILILAGLILSISSYVQNKGARARAETEIAAMSAALESYKADNGIYPRDNPGNQYTDNLNAKADFDPTQPKYQNASLYLFFQLSGLDANQQAVANMKSYFAFKPQILGHPAGNTTTVAFIRDPFGNSYGYSTAQAVNPGGSAGYNPTYDLWSTAGKAPSPTPTPPAMQQDLWIKNW